MTDPIDPFERRLAARLTARAALATRPFDAHGIAEAAVLTRPPRRLAVPLPALRWPPLAWAWLVVLGLLAVLGASLVAGGLGRDPYPGPWLAVTRVDGLWIAHLDGTGERRIFAGADLGRPAWSADGAMIAVSTRATVEPSALTIVRTDGSVVRRLDDGGLPAWSPIGHRLAYWAPTSDEVRLLDLDAGTTSTVAHDAGGRWVTWSPDGTRLAIPTLSDADQAWQIVVRTLDGTAADVVIRPELAEVFGVDWSPDGSRITFATADGERCGTAAGVCPTQVAIVAAGSGRAIDRTAPLTWATEPRWSPGNEWIAWVALEGTAGPEAVFVGSLPLADHPAVALAELPGMVLMVDWLPDTSGLLVLQADVGPDTEGWVPQRLVRVPLDGGEAVPVLDGLQGADIQPNR